MCIRNQTGLNILFQRYGRAQKIKTFFQIFYIVKQSNFHFIVSLNLPVYDYKIHTTYNNLFSIFSLSEIAN